MGIVLPNMALRVWNLPSDPYDSSQLADNFARIDQHDHTFGKGVQIPSAGIEDGAITATKLDPAAVSTNIPFGGISADQLANAVQLGLNTTGVNRRGTLNIATAQATSSVTYTTLATPDQVSVTVPTNGYLTVMYQATWQESVAGASRASIFIGSNQLKTAVEQGTAPVTQAAANPDGTPATDSLLATYNGGLFGGLNNVAYTGDVTTGQLQGYSDPVGDISTTNFEAYEEIGGTLAKLANRGHYGGDCRIIGLPAGTYTISVQFKASSGTVTAKNRKLWVLVYGF